MISVCIPTYEQHGQGRRFLKQLLHSILPQREVEFEVVVSDNSKDNQIEELCGSYMAPGGYGLPLRYLRNREKIGISNNTNNAIEHAAYEHIKLMYQDDLFLSPVALSRFDAALSRSPWAIASYWSMGSDSRPRKRHDPFWHDQMLMGKNTIGMPSVLGIRRNGLIFDPNLRTRLDCEYYWLLYREYGLPEFIREPLVALRYWDKSSSRIQGHCTEAEYAYLRSKHGVV